MQHLVAVRQWLVSTVLSFRQVNSSSPHDRSWHSLTSKVNGQVTLVAQDEPCLIEVGLSRSSGPTSDGYFETVIAATRISGLNSGHMCFPVSNSAVDAEVGSNATLQIRYTLDWETDRKVTYYACADIMYVSTSQSSTQVPCFSATVDNLEVSDVDDEEDDNDDDDADDEDDDADNDNDSQSTILSDDEVAVSTQSSSLSSGAIAGIVIGVVA